MGPVGKAYAVLVAAGELRPDPDQKHAVQALDRLAGELANGRAGFFERLLRRQAKHARGVYLWGGVGRGKSMLMDLAFDHIPVEPKRRVHFHAFMLDIHQRLRAARANEEGNPIPPVAQSVADEARLLCFDEMHVTNAADAMLMSRLFTALLDEGVAVVTTSTAAEGPLQTAQP
jgi:cell division protein ZapE